MTVKVSDVTSRIEVIAARLKSGVNRTEPEQEAVTPVSDDMAIVERDRAALSAMLDEALKRAGSKDLMLVYGLPPPRDPMPEHATYWSADRGYLKHCWGPVALQGPRVAPHPAGEATDRPPSAMACSARLP